MANIKEINNTRGVTVKKTFIALVPMKGHSERLPKKNTRDLCGKPLMYYILKEINRSNYIREIIVNTDNEHIANLASREFKATIIKRPIYLCGGHVPMNDIIKHDLERIDGNYFIQTHATNPLLAVNTIDRAIETFINSECDSLFSVSKIQSRLYWRNGSPVNHNPKELINTQDMPVIYEENSCLYIFTRESFIKNNSRVGKNPLMFEIPKNEAVDIDEEIDFKIAEALMQAKIKEVLCR